ncbi:MAG: sensor histidine kinase [Proteobacteria bacterium]|nr:sensor histidine kinase [Pseudomonadota bacterium]
MTIAFVHIGLRIDLPVTSMVAVVGLMAVLNVVDMLRHRTHPRVTNKELLFELLVDVAALTTQLYLSGGATNPFVTLYLLQVILGAVLLEMWSAWVLMAVTSACFLALMFLYRKLAIPEASTVPGLHLAVVGMLVSYILAAALIVVFVTRITANLRARDARLAAARQQSAEEELIVHMGLLASGAAHELGTPLSTMAVILHDWQELDILRKDREVAVDLAEMQEQILRCKQILSRVLVSAGAIRGEGATASSVLAFFDRAVASWLGGRDGSFLEYENSFFPDLPIVGDMALQQGLLNALDNAFEVSPTWIGLKVRREDELLVVTISDRGPGFSGEALAAFGQPYQSTKGQPGGGLGLFLLASAVRKLGGSVVACNRAEGGASVELRLPLASLSLEQPHDG